MVKHITYYTSILFILACHSNKSMVNNIDESCKKEKIQKIKNLSSYTSLSDNGLYDIRLDSIVIPEGYDTIAYRTKLGIITNVKIEEVRRLEHAKILFQLLDSCNYVVKVADIISHYQVPTDIGRNRQGDTTSLFYYFNTKTFPDCRTPYDKNQDFGNCQLLSFDFDDNGYLNDLNGAFFYY